MLQSLVLLAVFRLFLSLLGLCSVSAYPQHEWAKRQVTQDDLHQEYDYIIVGGGQSGLVIANRLSEDLKCKSPFT